MLRQQALNAIISNTIDQKIELTESIPVDGLIDISIRYSTDKQLPGCEERPVLVHPHSLPKRSMTTLEGRATLIHSLAHIELNAVNLALDIVWRFAYMPEQFYRDWIGVAKEEAYHFKLLRQHLQHLGYQYGDFPAHNGLWEMAEKTKEDILARLALVPRTLEARGLDVTVPIRNKLLQAGDEKAATILDIILNDEIKHVAIGNHWYNYVCQEKDIDPIGAYSSLAEKYSAPKLRGPFNIEARRAAGFSDEELAALKSIK